MSTTKIGENATNILKLLFFIVNLHFVTSNQLSTSGKLNLSLTSSVYFVFFPLELQKRFKQKNFTMRFPTLSEKKRPTNLQKYQLEEPFFWVCMLLLQLVSMNAFYSVWYLKNIAFHESLSLLWYCFKSHVATFFEAGVLQEVRILCFISATTKVQKIPKFKNKADCSS